MASRRFIEVRTITRSETADTRLVFDLAEAARPPERVEADLPMRPDFAPLLRDDFDFVGT